MDTIFNTFGVTRIIKINIYNYEKNDAGICLCAGTTKFLCVSKEICCPRGQATRNSGYVEYCNSKAARQITAESRIDLPNENHAVCICYEGPENVVKWQAQQIIDEWRAISSLDAQIIEEAQASQLYNALTEYQTSSDDPVTLKAVVLPSQMMSFIETATSLNIAVQAHAADGIVFGHLPDSASSLENVNQILEQLQSVIDPGTGYLTIYQCESDWAESLPLFCSLPAGWELMQQLKQALDPLQLLNSRRFTELVKS